MQSININCPYCGESIELLIDDSIPEQEYIEDCSVCCCPIMVMQHVDELSGDVVVNVRNENE